VFNPATKVWTASDAKPSAERIQELKNLQEEAKKFIELLKSEISPNLDNNLDNSLAEE
jgi:hypothetical protein